MGDGSRSSKSFVDTLKNEWSLFLESFIEDHDEQPEQQKINLKKKKSAELPQSVVELKELKRLLSAERKNIIQKLESLQKEVDLNSAKLESMRLMGSEEQEIVNRLNELNDMGHKLSHQLVRVDERMKLLHQKESEVLKGLRP